jgi:hypothetical protein
MTSFRRCDHLVRRRGSRCGFATRVGSIDSTPIFDLPRSYLRHIPWRYAGLLQGPNGIDSEALFDLFVPGCLRRR